MSVYTPVSHSQLEEFLASYPCGTLLDFTGISAGIENTNYFVTTDRGQYVLTLFEVLSRAELPYFLDLMAFFAEHGIPSAHPVADRSGAYLRELQGKPAALVQRLQGASVEEPDVMHCRQVGAMLARMHEGGQAFSRSRKNDRGPHWWREMQAKLSASLQREERTLLDDELAYQASNRNPALPRGVIHADLFRDNALFLDHELAGVIDFYYACNDVLLYDIAVAVNDWCGDADGGVDRERAIAMLAAYHEVRPLGAVEVNAWPAVLRAAALRFWLSRLHDWHFQREGEITHTKDPGEFLQILLHRRQHEDELRVLLQHALS